MESSGDLHLQKLISAALLLFLTTALVLLALAFHGGSGAAQGAVEIGVDADPTGNDADVFDARDDCISVNTGDAFQVDIYVKGVDELAHWELYFTFDPTIVNLVDVNTRMFLDVTTGSSVKGQVDHISDGEHFLGAADLKDAPESDSGVLARLSLTAVGPGLTGAEFLFDEDPTGRAVKGPRLTNSQGDAIGDNTGDDVFDKLPGGSPYDALIAVDESCPVILPTPTPTPPPVDGVDDDGDTLIDEDPRDGVDNDGDTLIDEDPQAAIDNDGDTLIDEDPLDGVDNDGDTAIDEDGEDAQGLADEGTDGAGDSDEDSPPIVLASDGTPNASDSGAGPVLGGNPSTSSSSGGGLPLWAIVLIAAAVLVAGAGGSVFLVARSGNRFGR
jgi:hypothetical protein